MKITDAKIRTLLDGKHRGIARAALMILAQHGSLARRVRRKARIECAKIIETQKAKVRK